MDLSVTQKLGVFQTGNQPQNTRLLAEFEVVLEAYHIVGVSPQILLAQLYHSVGGTSCSGIAQTHRLHWPEAQRVAATTCYLLDRQTAFEVVQLFPILRLHRLRFQQRV